MRSVLLDTHIALWILSDSPRLPSEIRRAANDEEIDWILHQTSIWEIQIKYSLGKLHLPASPELYLPEGVRRSRFVERSIENAGIFMLDRLPQYHSDPFDRLLIAHAMLHDWEIATADPAWARYPVRLMPL